MIKWKKTSFSICLNSKSGHVINFKDMLKQNLLNQQKPHTNSIVSGDAWMVNGSRQALTEYYHSNDLFIFIEILIKKLTVD